MAVTFTITGCWMAVKGTIPNEAFIGILTLVVNEYFKRSDRSSEKVNLDDAQKHDKQNTTI